MLKKDQENIQMLKKKNEFAKKEHGKIENYVRKNKAIENGRLKEVINASKKINIFFK